MMSMENNIEKVNTQNYLLQICEYCKKELQLSEGDVIYGNKWYHKLCWISIKKKNLEKIDQTLGVGICQN